MPAPCIDEGACSGVQATDADLDVAGVLALAPPPALASDERR